MGNKRTFTEEEKTKIIARAEELGYNKVSEEYGIVWQTISSWKKQLKAKNKDSAKQNDSIKKIQGNNTDNSESLSKNSNLRLELENIVLKERVADLSLKVDKLKRAIEKLI